MKIRSGFHWWRAKASELPQSEKAATTREACGQEGYKTRNRVFISVTGICRSHECKDTTLGGQFHRALILYVTARVHPWLGEIPCPWLLEAKCNFSVLSLFLYSTLYFFWWPLPQARCCPGGPFCRLFFHYILALSVSGQRRLSRDIQVN